MIYCNRYLMCLQACTGMDWNSSFCCLWHNTKIFIFFLAAKVTLADFGYLPMVFLLQKTFELFGVPLFWLSVHMVKSKIITETHRTY
jgi:hypothetical protein